MFEIFVGFWVEKLKNKEAWSIGLIKPTSTPHSYFIIT